jgi:hypothetical protein
MTNQKCKVLHQRRYDDPGTTVEQHGIGWDSSMFFGLGVGYKFTDWFRVRPVTGEYPRQGQFPRLRPRTTFTGGFGADQLYRQQVRMGGPGQRVRRSRHLGGASRPTSA